MVITSATTVSPRHLAEFGCAGFLPKPFPLETLVDDDRARPGSRRGTDETTMTDLQILVIGAVATLVAVGLPRSCVERVRG